MRWLPHADGNINEFWRSSLLDLTSLLTSGCFTLLWRIPATLAVFFAVSLWTQAAFFVAILVLPRAERRLVWPWPAAIQKTKRLAVYEPYSTPKATRQVSWCPRMCLVLARQPVSGGSQDLPGPAHWSSMD